MAPVAYIQLLAALSLLGYKRHTEDIKTAKRPICKSFWSVFCLWQGKFVRALFCGDKRFRTKWLWVRCFLTLKARCGQLGVRRHGNVLRRSFVLCSFMRPLAITVHLSFDSIRVQYCWVCTKITGLIAEYVRATIGTACGRRARPSPATSFDYLLHVSVSYLRLVVVKFVFPCCRQQKVG